MPEKKNTIGRFEIIEKIGEGPIGAVYKALDPVIRRTVAIKVIKLYALEETTTFAEVFEKIYRVVRTSTSLNHPNICIIYDLSEEKKIPYITMEYVEGRDLSSLLMKKHQFKKQELLNILNQTCDALDFAHKKNVLHQDLKSTNILVTPDLHVKITDFGIAGLDEIAAAQTKKLLSIPFYISPEQALGERVSTGSDLFSLGVVFYHLLSGQLPFPGTSAANAIMMIARDNPVLPVDLEKSGISRDDWETFFSIALAKTPNQRFKSAREMLEALSAILPSSDHTYFPFSFAGAANDSTGKFEKTFVADAATPTLMIDSSQILEESGLEQNRAPDPISSTSANTLPQIPPLEELKPAHEEVDSPPTQLIAPLPRTSEMELQNEPDPAQTISPGSYESADHNESAQTFVQHPEPVRAPIPPPPPMSQPPEASTQLIDLSANSTPFETDEDLDEYAQTIKPSRASDVFAEQQTVPSVKAQLPEESEEAPTMIQHPPAASSKTVIGDAHNEPMVVPNTMRQSPAQYTPSFADTQKPAAPSIPEPPVKKEPAVVREPTPAPAGRTVISEPAFQHHAAATVIQEQPSFSSSAPTVMQQSPVPRPSKQEVPAMIPLPEAPVPPPRQEPSVTKSAGPPNMRRYMIAAIGTAIFIALVAGGIYLLRDKPEPEVATTTPPVSQPQPAPAPAEPAPAPSVPTAGSVMITSEPAGATVLVDGVEKGLTPLEIPDLQFGTHAVKMQLKGYRDVEQQVQISADSPYATIPVTFQKAAAAVGTLVVESSPEGAFIVISNRVMGVTPKTLPNTKPGNYSITLKKDGYNDFTGTIRVAQNKSATFKGELAEIPKPVVVVEPPKPKEPEVRPGQLVSLTPDVIPPKAIKKVYAKYPESAKSKKLEGTVRISLLVDETGQVIDMKVTKPAHPLLDEAVMKAYKEWTFAPATKQGVPVKVWITGTMSFQATR